MVDTVSAASARRIALAAQGFARPRPAAVGKRQLNALIGRLGLLQLDSVNVFERSHYMPVFARLGAYDKATLDALTFARGGEYVEYWAHEAAVIPVETWPLLRWRMQHYRDKHAADLSAWAHTNEPMIAWLKAELAEKGPLPASAIEHDANKRNGPWWGWSDVKIGLEVLFRWGELASAGRTRFERNYALPEQVLPASVIERAVPRAEAQRELVRHAAEAHGIGTAGDFADYFRMGRVDTLAAVHSLVEEGVLLPVTVEGWKQPAWLHRDARVPRRVEAAALLSPFDPVVWDRKRAERLFGFHYRIEIYTPAPKRVFGYYSLPILLGDTVVGRIDLKNDRQAGVLRVQSAWHEEGASPTSLPSWRRWCAPPPSGRASVRSR
ncbi:winged helix-turn-helix domain-containing protein [Microterricola viridarii]|uniref:winged helix-turn-helix domain-containing protein n=1 Tax=Microterricola viridarii TaxID=412690 RepID=UPI000A5C2E11